MYDITFLSFWKIRSYLREISYSFFRLCACERALFIGIHVPTSKFGCVYNIINYVVLSLDETPPSTRRAYNIIFTISADKIDRKAHYSQKTAERERERTH